MLFRRKMLVVNWDLHKINQCFFMQKKALSLTKLSSTNKDRKKLFRSLNNTFKKVKKLKKTRIQIPYNILFYFY